MAEGILRKFAGRILDVHSAGSKPTGRVHRDAVTVMHEIGIDISAHQSKHVDRFLNQPVSTLITMCRNDERECQVFPGNVSRYHWEFEDPALVDGPRDEVLATFRNTCNKIERIFSMYAGGFLATWNGMCRTESRAR